LNVVNSYYRVSIDIINVCFLDKSSCHARADIVFVVDSSGSVNEHDKGNWDRMKNFAKSIVGTLDIGEDRVRVGMVEFGNEGVVQFYLNSHYNVPDMTEDIDRSVTNDTCSLITSRRLFLALSFCCCCYNIDQWRSVDYRR